MQGLPDWNAIRFDAERPRGHVESYFVKANDPQGRRALWLKATIIGSSVRPAHAMAEAWAVVFDRQGQHVAVKESVPFATAGFSHEALDVRIGDFLRFDSAGSRGCIDRGEHHVEWDLRWKHHGQPLVHFPLAKMYTGPFPKSKLVSPYPDLTMDGKFAVDGHDFDVKQWRGMQGHNWGRGHADIYAWGHCNCWDQNVDTVVEAVSARVRVGPVLTPLMTLVCVRHDGREYRFTHPHHLMRNRGEVHPRRWFFGAKDKRLSVRRETSRRRPTTSSVCTIQIRMAR